MVDLSDDLLCGTSLCFKILGTTSLPLVPLPLGVITTLEDTIFGYLSVPLLCSDHFKVCVTTVTCFTFSQDNLGQCLVQLPLSFKGSCVLCRVCMCVCLPLRVNQQDMGKALQGSCQADTIVNQKYRLFLLKISTLNLPLIILKISLKYARKLSSKIYILHTTSHFPFSQLSELHSNLYPLLPFYLCFLSCVFLLQNTIIFFLLAAIHLQICLLLMLQHLRSCQLIL